MEDWLSEVYFDDDADGRIFQEVIRTDIARSQSGTRTLFILDGLDEVSGELLSETAALLKRLVKQPDVIITSRPAILGHLDIGCIDLELEVTGFDTDQVGAYVKAVVPGLGAQDIIDFIEGLQLVQELVCIPIQLEALCYSWSHGSVAVLMDRTAQTMTMMYKTMEPGL
jgi:hypothetical protein